MQLLEHLQLLPPGSLHPLSFSKLLFSFYIRPPQKDHEVKTKLTFNLTVNLQPGC